MEALFLICSIAGQRVALPADNVESVVEIDAITPIPLVAAHVAGLFALRSRVLTIIDSVTALGIGVTERTGTMQAVIVDREGHPYGLLVDEVEDVVASPAPVGPVRVALGDRWARAARGLIEHEGQALLLIDPAILIAGPAAIAA